MFLAQLQKTNRIKEKETALAPGALMQGPSCLLKIRKVAGRNVYRIFKKIMG
jgi:hypothetical protein